MSCMTLFFIMVISRGGFKTGLQVWLIDPKKKNEEEKITHKKFKWDRGPLYVVPSCQSADSLPYFVHDP